MTETGSGSIHARIARVQAAVENMPRDKKAVIKMKNGGTFEFDYITKGALMHQARSMFSPEGVAIYVSEEAIVQTGNRCMVTVSITLACASEHEPRASEPDGMVVLKRSAYGNADDDKGPQKAGTTAVRLALADLLLQGGDEMAMEESVEYRADVPGQALQEGDRPATPEQLKYAADLVMRAQLDKAMPTASHAILRLARPIAQSEIGPGLEVVDAIRLIPQAVMSKLIERVDKVKPAGAKAVWDNVAEWEAENGYAAGVDPEDTKIEPAPDPEMDIPF